MNAKKSKLSPWEFVPYGAFTLATSIGATQFVASRFNHNPLLGQPIVNGFYAPWNWLIWEIQFRQQGPQTFAILNICLMLFTAGMLYTAMMRHRIRNRRGIEPEGVHGTAHFAAADEVQETGLLAPDGESGNGVYVGAWTDAKGKTHFLRHDGPEHIAAIAPTRSGKGVGLVIPTLLAWPASTVIHDMKGELWNLTAGYRKKGLHNVVLKFDPAAQSGSCKFNPLAEVRLGEASETADVQNLATIIVDPDGKGLHDHWTKTAHAFLTGVILYSLYKAQDDKQPTPSLAGVMSMLSNPSRPIAELYEEMVQYPHSTIAESGQDMKDRDERECTGVLSSVKSYLSLYRDDLVATNTSASDFRISDLMNHTQPVSLYLVVRPADKDRLKPLMRLILNQIVRTLARDEMKFENGRPKKSYQHRLLLMLDEFPSFGKLEVFQEALAFIAGYGIKAYLIMQDLTQLHAAYTANESIISNCHIRVAYAPNNPKTAEWLSSILGKTTRIWKNASLSGKRMGGMLNQVSESYQSTGRNLMTADEVMRLKAPAKDAKGNITEAGEMLILVSGHAPIKGKQILYFQEAFFEAASRIPAPVASQRLEVASAKRKVPIRAGEQLAVEEGLSEEVVPVAVGNPL
jgi:type IV secretion system protein VirD4